MKPVHHIHTATLPDAKRVAAIIADGFCDDPPMTFCFNGSAAIEPVAKVLAERIYLRHGFTLLAEKPNGEQAGTAMWLDAKTHAQENLHTMILLTMSILRYGGPTAVWRSLSFSSFMEKHHPPEPHYYLFALATTQAARGQGVGGELLKAGLAKADADGVGCYLENSKFANLGFYRAHGFELMNKVQPMRGSPPLWRMWRPPQ